MSKSLQQLKRNLFQSDAPEVITQSLPPQTLYMLIKRDGLESSTDVINLLTIDQFRICLDLDLWSGDSFYEDSFWEWLAISDESDDRGDHLKYLKKILRSIDLKLIGILITKYVKVVYNDEPTENPPSPRYYTPDKGYTWVNVDIDDGTKHLYFTKLLALIFDADPNLFYQILAIPGVSTISTLEEDSYTERNKRLSTEGIPEPDFATELNTPMAPYEMLQIIDKKVKHLTINDIAPVTPIVYEGLSSIEPFRSLLGEIGGLEDVQAELTLVSNASIVFFNIPYYEQEILVLHLEKVRGAINIGLQKVMNAHELSFRVAFDLFGFQGLYRVGLYELFELRKVAYKISEDNLKSLSVEDQITFSLVAHCRQSFPINFFKDGAIPFVNLNEVVEIKKVLERV